MNLNFKVMVKTEVTHNRRPVKTILSTLNTHTHSVSRHKPPDYLQDFCNVCEHRITVKCLRGSRVSPQVQWRTEPPLDISDRAHCCYLNGLIFRILEHWQLGFFMINADSTYKAQRFQLPMAQHLFRSCFWRMKLRIDSHREAHHCKTPSNHPRQVHQYQHGSSQQSAVY